MYRQLKKLVKQQYLPHMSYMWGIHVGEISPRISPRISWEISWISPRPTQPPILSGTGNEYQPKCGDALRLRSQVWFIPLVDKRVEGAGKTV